MGELEEAINDLQEIADTSKGSFEETFQNHIDPDTAVRKVLFQLLVPK